ncbi:MAG TPA: hypothetical protein VKG78_10960, partial [Opitutaceae bacterium]|nr:hypothetical protein [Opitutaceae bacterium]
MDPTPRNPAGPRPSAARSCLAGAFLLAAAGCAVGPDYRRPEVAAPAAFKEDAQWRVAAPEDAAPRGPWWEVFNDPVL